MEYRIRAGEPSDLSKILLLENEIFTDPWTERMLADVFRAPHLRMLVAEENGEILGYATIGIVMDEGELQNIGVSKKARRRGVGTGLMNRMMGLFEEAGVLRAFLEVRESNAPAIALYEGFGFQQVAKRNNYYESPVENALIYAWNRREKQEKS